MTTEYTISELFTDFQKAQGLSDADFDQSIRAIKENLKRTPKCVEPQVDGSPWNEFCREVQGADQSDMKQHHEYHDDAEALDILQEIALTLPATEDTLKGLDHVEKVTISTPTWSSVPTTPSGDKCHKVDFMVRIPGEPRVQRAHCVDFSKCRMARRANDAVSFVTDEPSPHESSTMSFTLWCSKSEGEYTLVRPGTACFTGTQVGTTFNWFYGVNGLINGIDDPEIEDTEVDTRRTNLRNNLKNWMESPDFVEGRIWALQQVDGTTYV
jgi:hypothetical protein